MKRKRGAPPGNQNAFRHGFYSASFRQQELRALSQSNDLELADEIALMRVATARLLASVDAHKEKRDLHTELSIFRAFNLSVHSIRALIRTRLMLKRDGWAFSPVLQPHDRDHLTAPDAVEPQTGTAPGA